MASIGVTGHRSLAATPELTRAIDEALDRIARAFPDTPTTVISPLAEGADRLVVQRAFARGACRLVVPLPLPKAEYVRWFTSTDSEREFDALLDRADEIVSMPPTTTPVEAYHAVGRWVLDHADVLLAVWDGTPPRGEGGTGAAVDEARARGLPMAWVRVSTDQSSSAEHGSDLGINVTCERLPYRPDRSPT
jgi:hypothetical protein